MKIHILTKLKKGPWGGANQFLKALRSYFIDQGVYVENAKDADIVLFNSFPFGNVKPSLRQLCSLRRDGKFLIHRLDGPISLYRGRDNYIDKMLFSMNAAFASGTIFQSDWSRKENKELGCKKQKYEMTIINAPDPTVFNISGRISFSSDRKIRLIATSWSDNMRKGYALYQFLDKNLDFNKYSFTFIGNAPCTFINIEAHSPMPSKKIAEQLKQHDIFLTASQKDPCSNALIEALHCGLPAVVLNDGGHPEIIGNAGEVYNGKEDVLAMIDKVAGSCKKYQEAISLPTINNVAGKYFDFMQHVYDGVQDDKLKKCSKLMPNYLMTKMWFFKALDKLKRY